MSKLLVNFKLVSVLILCIAALIVAPVMAQDAGSRELLPDQTISSMSDPSAPAQIFNFILTESADIALGLSGQAGTAFSMTLSDAQGNLLGVAQTTGIPDTGLSVILNAEGLSAGTYYVTVFVTAGVATSTSGEFDIVLSLDQPTAPEEIEAEATEEISDEVEEVATPEPTPARTEYAPGTVSLFNGIQVRLIWNTIDDLNLQVRAPNGETLFWDSRTTSDGGTFGPDANGLCENIVEPPSVETATWNGGVLSTGSYEILVYYRQACEGNNPVDFTVEIDVDGVALDPIVATIAPPVDNTARVYISSFTVYDDGTAATGIGGPYTDTQVLPLPPAEILALPDEQLTLDIPVTGFVINEQPWQTFTFEGQSGQVVAINLTAIQGSLDTLLLVMDSAGNIVGANDDIEPAIITDSAIEALRLPVTDTYTIIATRYGKDVGGTEGIFELVISESTNALPEQISQFNLPVGDIEVILTWDTDADLRLLVRDPFGDSVYSDIQRIQSGGQLGATGNLNCTATPGTPVYYIYWPEGLLRAGTFEIEAWHNSECDDFRQVTFSLYVVVNGELVMVENSTITFRQRYITSFTVNADGSARGHAGGFLGNSETLNIQAEMPSALNITSGQTLLGSITLDDKFDLYLFEGQPGDVVTVAMNATSGNLDPLLYVLDPSGIEIASNDDAEGSINSLISGLTLSQPGTYTIVATHFGTAYGGTIGGYELSLRIDR